MSDPEDELREISNELEWLCTKWSDGVFHNDSLLLYGCEQRIRFLITKKEELEYGQMTLFRFKHPDIIHFEQATTEDERWARLRTLASVYMRDRVNYGESPRMLAKIRSLSKERRIRG